MEGLIIWNFYLDIIKVDEFPTIKVGPDCDIHIFHSCSFKPPSRLFECLDSPNTGGSVETKEIQEHPINLLLHLKVEAQINVLETSQQVLVLVHKRPSSLNQTKLGIVLQHERNKARKIKFLIFEECSDRNSLVSA